MTETGAIFLQFLPLLMITVLANMGEGAALFRRLTQLALIVMNLALIGMGMLFMVMAGQELGGAAAGADFGFDTPVAGALIAAAGVGGFLPLIPAVQASVARLIPIEPGNTVHITALTFAIYLAGITASQLFLDLPAAIAAGAAPTVAAAWEQALIFVLLALLGVGLGLRRTWTETARRLGLAGLTGRQVALSLAIVAGLTLFDLAVSYSWYAVDPASYEALAEVTRALFEDFVSPFGALTLGLSAGIGEELLFRGAVQPRFGLWVTTLLFTLGHVQYSISPALLQVFLIGLILGVIRRRENTTMAVLIHAVYNALNVAVAPLAPGA